MKRFSKLMFRVALVAVVAGLGILLSLSRAQGSSGQDNGIPGVIAAIKQLNADMMSDFASLSSQLTSGFASITSQNTSGFSQLNGSLNQVAGTLNQVNTTLNGVSAEVSGLRVPSNGQTVLLAPFVANVQGYDTGMAIANTTLDQLGTAHHSGTCQLCYFDGSSSPPPCQTTTSAIPAGASLLFTLSGGGNYGIVARPGFEGYIIAKCDFPGAHGFAYVSAQGALPTSPGASFTVPVLVLPGTRDLTFVESSGE